MSTSNDSLHIKIKCFESKPIEDSSLVRDTYVKSMNRYDRSIYRYSEESSG